MESYPVLEPYKVQSCLGKMLHFEDMLKGLKDDLKNTRLIKKNGMGKRPRLYLDCQESDDKPYNTLANIYKSALEYIEKTLKCGQELNEKGECPEAHVKELMSMFDYGTDDGAGCYCGFPTLKAPKPNAKKPYNKDDLCGCCKSLVPDKNSSKLESKSSKMISRIVSKTSSNTAPKNKTKKGQPKIDLEKDCKGVMSVTKLEKIFNNCCNDKKGSYEANLRRELTRFIPDCSCVKHCDCLMTDDASLNSSSFDRFIVDVMRALPPCNNPNTTNKRSGDVICTICQICTNKES